MKTGFTKRALSIVLSICMLFSAFTFTAFATGTTWTPSANTKIFVDVDSVGGFEDLKYEANFFGEEYREKVGTKLAVTMGSADDVGDHDILLTYDATIPARGYEISLHGTRLTIAASDDDGIFYGWHNVIKQMMVNGSVAYAYEAPDVAERSVSLDNGRKYYTVDWIKQLIREMAWADMNTLVMHFSEEMGLGLETKLYPWLNGRDGTLCTETELDADYDNRYLTQDELKEIAAYAEAYHVDLVPSLNSPGSLDYLVKTFNEKVQETGRYAFTYQDKTYTTEYSDGTYKGYVGEALVFTSAYGIGNYFSYDGSTSMVKGKQNAGHSHGIDISNEVAVAFVHSLIAEYGELFREVGAAKIDIGGDDLMGVDTAVVPVSVVSPWQQLDHWKAYARAKTGNANAVAYDAFLLYMNDLNALVRGLGYESVRMWNDGALRADDTGWAGVVQLDTNLDIWFRTLGRNTVWDYASAGYQVYNILSDYTYYVMTSDYYSPSRSGFSAAYADRIYKEWSPYRFDPTNATLGTGSNMAIGNANVLGGAFGIQCDNPTLRTETEVMADILPMLRAVGAKSWDAEENSDVSYSDFVSAWNKIGASAAIDLSTVNSFIPDPEALRVAVKDADAVNASDYDTVSYGAYMDAVAAGRDILDRGPASQDEIDSATLAIQQTKAALTIDKNGLEEAVAEFESISKGSYSAESYAAYVKAIVAARLVLSKENPKQSEIVAACNAILAAKAKLSANKADLRKALEQTPDPDTVDASKYPEHIYTAYMTAYENAKKVLADPDATQDEVNAALNAFEAAKADVYIDLSELRALVDASALVEAEKDKYVPIAYENYMFVINEAKTYYLSENALYFSQEDVDEMVAVIKTASDSYHLYTPAIAKDLFAAIDHYYDVMLDDHHANPYTIETWMFYSSSVKGAENLLREGRYSHQDVSKSLSELNGHLKSLNRESNVASQRHDIINSGNFQTDTAKTGATVRLALNTDRAYDTAAVMILNEEGFMVPIKNVTILPVNRRTPNQKILYVDFVLDVEPGVHTYTAYVTDQTSTSIFVMFCGDPVDCSITVE